MEGYINIDRAVEVLRSEPGLNNSSSCMEQLSWILLLKFLDELHYCIPEGLSYFDVDGIAPEYRWRAWAGNVYDGDYFDVNTSENKLLQFVEGELFPYMRSLGRRHGEGTLLANVGVVFTHLVNRITSSRTLVNVLRMVNEIDCAHVGEYGDMFDRLTQELSSSSAGYVQTPASLVRALVEVTAPEAGETIYDPAAGTGRFLVEAAMYIRQAEQRAPKPVMGFFACERNMEALALGLMNAIFHRVEPAYFQHGDALAEDEFFSVDGRQFDLVLSNLPFGGKVKSAYATQFCIETDSQELLFLQKCMESLRAGGRAVVIVPEGVLSQRSGPAVAIKQQLLRSFNLHTILSLPAGAFSPSTAVKASVLFFDKTSPTEETWMYECRTEQMLSKHRPLRAEHLADFVSAFKLRWDSDTARKVPVSDLTMNFDFSARNYISRQRVEPDNLALIVARVRETVDKSMAAMHRISTLVEREELHGLPWHIDRVPLRHLCISMKHGFAGKALDAGDVKFIRITDVQGGAVDWHGAQYVNLEGSQYESYTLNQGDIVFARVGATAGKSGLIREVPVKAVFASNLIKLVADPRRVIPEYLYLYLQSREFLDKVDKNLTGTVQLNISSAKLGAIEVPVPPMAEQYRIVGLFGEIYDEAAKLTALAEQKCLGLQALRTSLLHTLFRDA